MSNKYFIKLMKKKYEKKRKKVEEFVNRFNNENSIRIVELSKRHNNELIEDIEEICYRNQDLMSNDDLAKIFVVLNKIKED